MEVTERSPTQEQDPNYLEYGDDILNVGAGIRVVYDTRDDTVNAYTGRFFSIDADSLILISYSTISGKHTNILLNTSGGVINVEKITQK